MPIASADADIRCEIGGDEETKFIKIEMFYKDTPIHTLEFAEITPDIKELIETNTQVKLYSSSEEILSDLADVYLFRYLKDDIVIDRLELLFKIRNKNKHVDGECRNDCSLCNPEFADDPVTDFTFDIKIVGSAGDS